MLCVIVVIIVTMVMVRAHVDPCISARAVVLLGINIVLCWLVPFL